MDQQTDRSTLRQLFVKNAKIVISEEIKGPYKEYIYVFRK
jgi:hypothetical protein